MATPSISKMHERVRRAERGSANAPLSGKFQRSNTFWSDAQNLYGTATDVVAKVGEQVLGLVADEEAVSRCEDHGALELCLNTLKRDMDAHMARLQNIYARHKDKHGMAAFEEIQEILAINEEYETAQNAYDGLIPPVIADIVSLLGHTQDAAEYILQHQKHAGEAELKLQQEQALAQAQDVNVVTDVQVKPARGDAQ
jgi:hypothetical protein